MNDGLKEKYRKAIIDILSVSPRVERVVLFGSRAMGTFTPTSDVDLVLYGDDLTLTDQAQFAEQIEELSMPQSVDLLLHKSIKSKELLKHIEKYGVEWWRRRRGGSEWRLTEYGSMNERLSRSSLADLCIPKIGIQTGPFGSQLHKKDYVDSGTPIITVEHLGDNRITHQNLPCVSDEDKSRLSKYTLETGDIVFSRVGSVDRRSIVRDEEDGWMFSGRCLRVRAEKTAINPAFLSWFFGYEGFRAHIRRIAVGATMPSLNTKILSQVPIYYPPLPEQRAIAHILGSLDDKIELNRQMNRTLEKMAQAIFKSWFIDFDPVRAKAEGRDPGLPKEIADFFPGSLEGSELGQIPKGWEVKPIGDVIELAYGKSLPKKKRVHGQFPVYGSGGITGFHNEHIVEGPGIIVGRKGTVGSVYWEERGFFPIDTVFYVNTKIWLPLYWVFLRLSLMDIQKLGADSAVPGVNRNSVYAQKWIVPADEVVKKFQVLSDGFLRQAEENRQQIHNLSKTRDTLLPKLISGELPIPDAEKFLEEAGV